MTLTSDWHIHTHNSCDEAALAVPDLVAAAAALGISDYGITDHIHTPVNLPDLEASRRDFLACNPSPRFHFGVEVSCVSAWELEEIAAGGRGKPVYGLRQGGPAGAAPAIGIAREDLERLGVEYVVGGVHWPLYVPFERETIIRDYHRQYLSMAAHPLVTIIAHPWWFMGHWRDADGRYTTDPWLDDFRKVPLSLHDELAAAAVEHGKAVEINVGACLMNGSYPETFTAQYLEYLAFMKGRGVRFSLASDCHSRCYAPDFEKAAGMLESVGIRDEDLWRLPPRVR